MHKPTHIFDDLEVLRQDGEQLMAKLKKAGNRRTRSDETFARIFHDRALQLYKHIGGAPWIILSELDRLILVSKGRNPVPFGHERLFAIGMARSTINRALRQLQKAKIIHVERWGRHAKDVTLVTHFWYPQVK